MSRLLRATLALYVAHLLTYLRSRTAVYWTLAFPLFFLLIFGFAFGRGRPEVFNVLMPGQPLSIVLAHGAMRLTTLLASLFVQAIVARFLFGFRITGTIPALVMV